MKPLKEWIVPWLYSAREYNVGILDKAMDNPQNARLMLNENPIPPSDKVIEAVDGLVRIEDLQGVDIFQDLVHRHPLGKGDGAVRGRHQGCRSQARFHELAVLQLLALVLQYLCQLFEKAHGDFPLPDYSAAC